MTYTLEFTVYLDEEQDSYRCNKIFEYLIEQRYAMVEQVNTISDKAVIFANVGEGETS